MCLTCLFLMLRKTPGVDAHRLKSSLEGKGVNCAEIPAGGERQRRLSSQPPRRQAQWQVCRLIRTSVRQLLCDPAGLWVVLQDQDLEMPHFQRPHRACPPALASSSQTCTRSSSVFLINWSQRFENTLASSR